MKPLNPPKKPQKYKRWYDRYDNITVLVDTTEKLPRACQLYIGQCLVEIVEMYQDLLKRQNGDIKSIGAEEIQSLYKSKKKLRWYDEIPELHRSLSALAMMPHEVLVNLNVRLIPLTKFIKSKPNLALLHPEMVNRHMEQFLSMAQFLNQR